MFDAIGTGATLAPEESSAQPQLGRLLVDRGFIGEEQLEYALSEHERTGLPLGQVLISLSYVTASTIAQALATQHGGLLKTEYGFGTGFDATLKGLDGEPPVSPQPALADVAVVPLVPPMPELEVELELAPELALAPMPAQALPSLELLEAQTRIAELVELAVASAREETGKVRQDAAIARHEAEMALQDAEATRRDLAASREDAEAARASVDAVRRELETARAETEAARQEAAAARQAVADNEACALQLQQVQAELAMTTENLRNAYARLHQFEIAQALQQAQPAPQVQHAPQPVQPVPAVQPAQPMQLAPRPPQAPPFTWQS